MLASDVLRGRQHEIQGRLRVVPLLGELYDAIDKTLDDERVPRDFDRID